jgi:hypothetical protein
MSFSSPLKVIYEFFQLVKTSKTLVTMINQCFREFKFH